MNPFQNRAIAASAGTGKTFRLVHRYIALMTAGVEPDRICALTFSRKAAGEIFDKIVAHLCAAATDAGKRAQTTAMITQEGFDAPPSQPAAYVGYLRSMLDNGHRLRIGTLDSFILGVVRAFPLELGIPPETKPMDGEGGEALAVRQAILTRLFNPLDRRQEGKSSSLLADFRQARFGQETKALAVILDRLIADFHGFYREHGSDRWHWGDKDALWPQHHRWWDACGVPEAIQATLPAQLATAFGDKGRAEKLGAACKDIASAAMTHASDKLWPQQLSKPVLARLLACAAANEVPEITYYGTPYTLPAALWPDLRRALGNLVAVEVERALAQTRGLHNVLQHYDEHYNEVLRTEGRFTFEDLSRRLGAGGLSRRHTAAEANRLYIDYRLDGQLDHWLLDEFQDTSDSQWGALANLIDEIVQDESRSFFYVGDVKQSIYGWRGGNHRLFGTVLANYTTLGPRAVMLESITRCHRSLPAVITAVNAVFENIEHWVPSAGAENGIRHAAAEAFSAIWKTHQSAREGQGDGYAALLEYAPPQRGAPAPGDANTEDTESPAEHEAVAAILAEVQPTAHGLTTAVLVRSNTAGRACVDVLRRRLPGVPVVHEGKGGITDTPVVTLLLALVRYAAHPGDTVALRHLQMSPLASQPAVQDHDTLPGIVLTALHTDGFAETLRDWGARLDRDLDPFGRQRLDELLAAAEQFDALGSCDPDAFAQHVQAYQVAASAAAGTIRVMTIHQAKGLGFDLVIVPFAPNAKSFGSPGDLELLAGDDWVLDPPCAHALEAADGEPVAAREAARADANFAQLCVLYVALTRAQQALYLVIPEKSKTSTTVREADLLRERLAADGAASDGPGGLKACFAVGDKEWVLRSTVPVPGPYAVGTAPSADPLPMTFATAIARHEPSKEMAEGHVFPAQWLFNIEAGDVLAFGSAIHRIFQKIVWLAETDIELIITEWRVASRESEKILHDVEQQFRTCLTHAEVRHMLNRPTDAPRAEVWLEAPFDLILEVDGNRVLTSGRFDRLVVERDTDGQPLRATVFDYKSNRISTEAEAQRAADGYAYQMKTYTLAAAHLLDLPPACATAKVLFTRTGWVWAY